MTVSVSAAPGRLGPMRRILLPLALLLFVGCSGGALSWECPSGLRMDPQRTERTRSLLVRIQRDAPRRLRACWGEVRPSVFLEGGVVHLDDRLGPEEAAARLAHLLAHESFTPPAPGEGCVKAWIRHEAEAMVRELDARALLGVAAGVLDYPFEGSVAAAEPANREVLVERWLWDHPDGGGDVDGLVTGYTRRCAPGGGTR